MDGIYWAAKRVSGAGQAETPALMQEAADAVNRDEITLAEAAGNLNVKGARRCLNQLRADTSPRAGAGLLPPGAQVRHGRDMKIAVADAMRTSGARPLESCRRFR